MYELTQADYEQIINFVFYAIMCLCFCLGFIAGSIR